MCTKILTVLLIPILVLGNSFAHATCCVAHASEENNRTHFHVGFGSNHDHDHGNHEHGHHDSESESHRHGNHDHDSNAVYLVVPDGEFCTHESVAIHFEGAAVFGQVAACISQSQVCLSRDVKSSHCFHGPPLYLLHHAIRI